MAPRDLDKCASRRDLEATETVTVRGPRPILREALWEQGDLVGVVVVVGGEEPTGAAVDGVEVGEDELGQELVAVGVVEGATAVVAVDAVFVVLVKSPALAGRAVLGEAIGGALAGLVHDDELRPGSVLVGFAEVSPETGFVDEIAATVEEISAGFVGNFGFSDVFRGASHVGVAHPAVWSTTAATTGDQENGGEREKEGPDAHERLFSGSEGVGQE